MGGGPLAEKTGISQTESGIWQWCYEHRLPIPPQSQTLTSLPALPRWRRRSHLIFFRISPGSRRQSFAHIADNRRGVMEAQLLSRSSSPNIDREYPPRSGTFLETHMPKNHRPASDARLLVQHCYVSPSSTPGPFLAGAFSKNALAWPAAHSRTVDYHQCHTVWHGDCTQFFADIRQGRASWPSHPNSREIRFTPPGASWLPQHGVQAQCHFTGNDALRSSRANRPSGYDPI